MNDYERESMIGWGQAAAAYAIIRENESMATGAMQNAVVQGIIEGQHTQYMVTRNTGDQRLGRLAGLGAQGRTTGWWLAVFGAPFALFMAGVGIFVAVGSPESGAGTWIGPLLLLACFVLVGYMMRKANRSHARNAYVRANLPSEKELNRSGYYQVEPDVWFNPINERVLTGHAYVAAEAAQGRREYHTESQQIRALYRQQRGSGSLSRLPGLLCPTTSSIAPADDED